MKKKLTAGLLVIVILIWGIIIYRLFTHQTAIYPAEAGAVYATPPANDTNRNYALIADYRDPFFDPLEAPAENLSEDLEPHVEGISVPVVPVPITYGGVIQNPATHEQVVILNIEGRDIMFTSGSSYQNVTFLKNYDTYIQILYNGKKETIYK